MRMAILIDRMSTNIEKIEKELGLVDTLKVQKEKEEQRLAEMEEEK